MKIRRTTSRSSKTLVSTGTSMVSSFKPSIAQNDGSSMMLVVSAKGEDGAMYSITLSAAEVMDMVRAMPVVQAAERMEGADLDVSEMMPLLNKFAVIIGAPR